LSVIIKSRNIFKYLSRIVISFRSKQIGRTFSIYAIGKIGSLVLSLFLLPLFTHRLPSADFGIIGLLWIIQPLLTRAINLGMDVTVSIKYFKQTTSDFSNSLFNCLFGMTVIAFAIWILGVLEIDILRQLIDNTLSITIYSLLIVSCLFSAYSTIMLSLFQNQGRAIANTVLTIAPSLLTVVTTYLFVFCLKANYTSYVWGMAIGSFIVGVLALSFFLKSYSIKSFSPSFAVIKELLKTGLPVVPGTVGYILLAYSDRYLIKLFLGLESVATYTFGTRLAEYLSQGLFEPFQKAFGPIIYAKTGRDAIEARRYGVKILNGCMVAFSIIAGFVLIPFHDFMSVMGGDKYSGSYIIFVVSVIAFFIWQVGSAESHPLMFMERTGIVTISTIVGAAISVVLNILLLPRVGIVAAALISNISYLSMFLIRNRILVRLFNLKSFSGLILRLGCFALYVVAIYSIDIASISSWLSYLTKFLLFVVYLAFVLKVFPECIQIIRELKRTTDSNIPSNVLSQIP
jgi:O-antigen/teichoic acid export membrane protein